MPPVGLVGAVGVGLVGVGLVGVGLVGVGLVGVGTLLQMSGSHSPQTLGNSLPHTMLHASLSLLLMFFFTQLMRDLTL